MRKGAGCSLTRGDARAERAFMTTDSTGTNWRNWSLGTRIFVGAGAVIAAAVVAYLYVA